MPLKKDSTSKIISQHGKNSKDSGSSEVQVALLTERINSLSPHFAKNIKDHHSRYGLIRMVNQRKQLLAYLNKQDPARYKKLIATLGLRK